MKFTSYDLGYHSQGEVVEVTLAGTEANVLLLDSSNFQNYRAGRNYRYNGGHYMRSPVRLAIPRSGHWYVAVDLGGYRGSVSSSVRILPGAIRATQEAPLSSVPSLVREGQNEPTISPVIGEEREYDVFISHASEDKDDIVRPLVLALQDKGLTVWFDESALRIGDSLRRKIDMGLAKTRFGIVVLSKSFLSKGWTNYELDGLVTKAVTGEQVILPIWHKISKQEVIDYSPSLADKLARSTSTHTVEEIAAEIAEVINARRM